MLIRACLSQRERRFTETKLEEMTDMVRLAYKGKEKRPRRVRKRIITEAGLEKDELSLVRIQKKIKKEEEEEAQSREEPQRKRLEKSEKMMLAS